MFNFSYLESHATCFLPAKSPCHSLLVWEPSKPPCLSPPGGNCAAATKMWPRKGERTTGEPGSPQPAVGELGKDIVVCAVWTMSFHWLCWQPELQRREWIWVTSFSTGGFHALWQWHSPRTVQVSGCLLGIPLWGMTIKCHHHSLYFIGSRWFTGSDPSLCKCRATLLCKSKCAGLQKWQTHLIRHGKWWVHLLYFLWALPA